MSEPVVVIFTPLYCLTLTYYGIKDLFVASMKADDKVWEP